MTDSRFTHSWYTTTHSGKSVSRCSLCGTYRRPEGKNDDELCLNAIKTFGANKALESYERNRMS